MSTTVFLFFHTDSKGTILNGRLDQKEGVSQVSIDRMWVVFYICLCRGSAHGACFDKTNNQL